LTGFLARVSIKTMTTIQQTVTIPPDRRLRLDMPLPESVNSGRVEIVLIIADEPAPKKSSPPKSEARDVELFKLHAEELNKEAADVLAYQDYFWEHYGSPWDHEP